MQSGGPERLAGVKLGDSPTFGTSLWSNKKSVDEEGEKETPNTERAQDCCEHSACLKTPSERWWSGSGAPTASHVLTLLFPGRLFQHALPPSLSQLSSYFSKVAHKMGRGGKGAPGHKDRKAFASPVISGTVKTGGIGWILLGL